MAAAAATPSTGSAPIASSRRCERARSSRREAHRPRHRRERHARRQRRARGWPATTTSSPSRAPARARVAGRPPGRGRPRARPASPDALLAGAPPAARPALRRAHRRRPLRGRPGRSPIASTPTLPGLLAAACRRRGARLDPRLHRRRLRRCPGPHREDASRRAPVNVYARLQAARRGARAGRAARRALVLRTTMHGWRPGPRTSFSEAILRGLLARRAAAALRRRAVLAARCRGHRGAGRCDCTSSASRGSSTSARPTPSTRREFGRVVARGFGLDPDAIEPIALAERQPDGRAPARPDHGRRPADVARRPAADGRGGRRAPAPRARGRHRGARSAAAAGARWWSCWDGRPHDHPRHRRPASRPRRAAVPHRGHRREPRRLARARAAPLRARGRTRAPTRPSSRTSRRRPSSPGGASTSCRRWRTRRPGRARSTTRTPRASVSLDWTAPLARALPRARHRVPDHAVRARPGRRRRPVRARASRSAPGDVTWPELLRHVAGKGKPVLLGTGASTLDGRRAGPRRTSRPRRASSSCSATRTTPATRRTSATSTCACCSCSPSASRRRCWGCPTTRPATSRPSRRSPSARGSSRSTSPTTPRARGPTTASR